MEKKSIWDLNRDDVATYRAKDKLPMVIVLDNIRSLNNIGSIFRTADAFLVEEVMLCGITACPPSPEIHKTALGAEDSVKWSYHASTLDAVAELHRRGYTLCCLEQVKGSVKLESYHPGRTQGYAIVVGHEVNGVAQEVVDAADVALEIPQHGTKHSLNVSVSAAIAMWHFYLHLRPEE